MKLGMYDKALEDANEVVKLDSAWPKVTSPSLALSSRCVSKGEVGCVVSCTILGVSKGRVWH